MAIFLQLTTSTTSITLEMEVHVAVVETLAQFLWWGDLLPIHCLIMSWQGCFTVGMYMLLPPQY